MTTVEINYEIAKLRDERQQLLNRANTISDCIQELAQLRTKQQLASRLSYEEALFALSSAEAPMDTPMADTYGGWAPLPAATIITYQTNTNELRQP